MSLPDPKDTLVEYLQTARDALVWKLGGLTELDVRRPLTATGTNLLGLVKHLAGVELEYFGVTFDRPSPVVLAWVEESGEVVDDNADLWARPEETREEILGLYRTAWLHAGETIAALDLDAVGRVPWWPAGEDEVTLHQVLVHVTTETCRHAGHADILRESLDGRAGRRPGDTDLDHGYDWPGHVARLQVAAEQAAGQQVVGQQVVGQQVERHDQ